MSNPVQEYMVTVLGVGTTEATQVAYRKFPPAAQPTVDVLRSVNGVPQTILPHPPQEYVWK